MVDRIRQLLQARQLSPTQFADTIGVARPIVSHILGGRNKPSLEVVQKIIAAFPDVALPWLLSGQGDMLANTAAPASSPGSASADTTAPIDPPRPSRRSTRAVEEPRMAPQPLPLPPKAEPDPALEPIMSPKPVEPAPVASAPAAPIAPPKPSLDPAVAPLLMTSTKSIRRVLIFYNDGTFADFSPSQDGF